MTSTASTITDIASEIRRYLADHPNATDSLEGVQRWWLLRGAVEAPGPSVQQALDLLVREGAVIKKILPDATIVYAGSHRGAVSH